MKPSAASPSWAEILTNPPTSDFERSSTQADAAAQQLWQATVSYVRNVVLADGALTTPLVLSFAGRLLAAVTLSAFPNTAIAYPMPDDHSDRHPILLRRAIEFIEANADKNIDLGDIAETVCLTPRAVQYMFRRHLDTTPLQYLRRIRLNRVHHELLTANRRHDTVSAIAARWGFMHAGRFASFYRQTYGRSPHITLRNGQPADKSSYGEDAEILVGKAFSEALMCLRNNSTHGCVGPNSVEQESRPPSRLERHSFRIPPPPLLTNLTMKVGRDAGMPHVGQHHWRSAGMA